MKDNTKDNKIYIGSIQMNLHPISSFPQILLYQQEKETRNPYAIPKL